MLCIIILTASCTICDIVIVALVMRGFLGKCRREGQREEDGGSSLEDPRIVEMTICEHGQRMTHEPVEGPESVGDNQSETKEDGAAAITANEEQYRYPPWDCGPTINVYHRTVIAMMRQ